MDEHLLFYTMRACLAEWQLRRKYIKLSYRASIERNKYIAFAMKSFVHFNLSILTASRVFFQISISCARFLTHPKLTRNKSINKKLLHCGRLIFDCVCEANERARKNSNYMRCICVCKLNCTMTYSVEWSLLRNPTMNTILNGVRGRVKIPMIGSSRSDNVPCKMRHDDKS